MNPDGETVNLENEWEDKIGNTLFCTTQLIELVIGGWARHGIIAPPHFTVIHVYSHISQPGPCDKKSDHVHPEDLLV